MMKKRATVSRGVVAIIEVNYFQKLHLDISLAIISNQDSMFSVFKHQAKFGALCGSWIMQLTLSRLVATDMTEIDTIVTVAADDTVIEVEGTDAASTLAAARAAAEDAGLMDGEFIQEPEYLKSIVYGGLDVSLTSLGVVASAAGGDAKTRKSLFYHKELGRLFSINGKNLSYYVSFLTFVCLLISGNVLALGLANLIFGFIAFCYKVICTPSLSCLALTSVPCGF